MQVVLQCHVMNLLTIIRTIVVNICLLLFHSHKTLSCRIKMILKLIMTTSPMIKYLEDKQSHIETRRLGQQSNQHQVALLEI